MRKPKRFLWFAKASLTLVVLIAGLIWIVSQFTIVSAVEHQESTEIADSLHFKFGAELAFAANPKPTRTDLTIYQVVEESDQDAIVDFLEERIELMKWSPIRIRFYEKPVRHVTRFEGGGSISVRGNELLLREVTVSKGFLGW